MTKQELLENFAKQYGNSAGAKVYFAPGRVNLIGEHIDYSGGHVLPCALTMGTYGVARLRRDDKVLFYSMNVPESGKRTYSLANCQEKQEEDWTNYCRGVIWAFEQKGFSLLQGMDVLFYGDLPSGAGLSSSASLEVLMGIILRDLYGFSVTNQEIALMGQKAEREFCGVNCGIMDQFAVALGKKNHALYLNTATGEYEYVPITLEHAKIVIANSNKKHNLNESKYNERRKECEKALQELQTVIGIRWLCDLDEETYSIYQCAIQDDRRKKRVRHAVCENARVEKAVMALRKNEWSEFGKLMNQSHHSLAEDYEVTGVEMDALAEAAWQQPEVFGSRITGGGFGGSTVSIVKESVIPSFIEQTGKYYTQKTGLMADFYVVEIGDGPMIQ